VKKSMRKKLLLPVVLMFALSLFSVNMTGVSAAVYPSVSVVPESVVDIIPGRTFTVAIYTDYTGPGIWGYEFSLSFDPTILYGVEVANGDRIVGLYSEFLPGQGFNNTEGTLSLVGAYFYYTKPARPRTVPGPGTLAYVTFKVIGTGTSDITIGIETKLKGWNPLLEHYDIVDGATMPDNLGHGSFDNTAAPPLQMPVAVITAPDRVDAEDSVTFSGAGSYDPDGTAIVSYVWDFGDGNGGTGETVTHVYTSDGIVTPSLLVTDEDDQESLPGYVTLEVEPPGPKPDADLAKWKAKAEKNRWVEHLDDDGVVTVTAMAINNIAETVDVKITFVVIDGATGIQVGDPLVATNTLPAGPEVTVPIEVLLNPYDYDYDGTIKKLFYLHVTLRYDSTGDGNYDTATKTKITRFSAVP